MTYNMPQTGDATRPMTVPKGAEVLLETRFPYLDDTQRRWVLYSTGLPSGYVFLDDAEGWGRLNLYEAGNGYGSFDVDVTVNMDASKGGFYAFDRSTRRYPCCLLNLRCGRHIGNICAPLNAGCLMNRLTHWDLRAPHRLFYAGLLQNG